MKGHRVYCNVEYITTLISQISNIFLADKASALSRVPSFASRCGLRNLDKPIVLLQTCIDVIIIYGSN